jgi:indolepyruvate ferredoxin oxidoreductase beta subunit
MTRLSDHRPIKIAIIAMGGQGGGVLSKWIVELAETNGFVAQYTSVPGVAQRTGATIYYLELFKKSKIDESGRQPVLALTPAEGDVDIVIASEMMEVGRALMRGFVTGKTTLIGSSHRDYSIVEKQELGDGRRNTGEIEVLARDTSAKFLCYDMDDIARRAGAVISSVLFGALCASSALPFTRDQFVATIRKSGRAVDRNMAGFEAGIEAAGGIPVQSDASASDAGLRADAESRLDPQMAKLADELRARLPSGAYELALAGLEKVVDFQDLRYGHEYVERICRTRDFDAANGGPDRNWGLTAAMVRYLALAMAYDDVIRVADIKTRSGRFESFRNDIRADDGQVVHIREYMHPRWQEICDILPRSIGCHLRDSPLWKRVSSPLFNKGRRIRITSLSGFTLLFLLGRLRFLRRRSLRFAVERQRIERWFELVLKIAPCNYELAVEIAGLQRLIKGYGETHARSLAGVGAIIEAMPAIETLDDAADRLRELKAAAMVDDEGKSLRERIGAVRMAA